MMLKILMYTFWCYFTSSVHRNTRK